MKTKINVPPLDEEEVIREHVYDFPLFFYHHGINYKIHSTIVGESIYWSHSFEIGSNKETNCGINRIKNSLLDAIHRIQDIQYTFKEKCENELFIIEIEHKTKIVKNSFAKEIHEILYDFGLEN